MRRSRCRRRSMPCPSIAGASWAPRAWCIGTVRKTGTAVVVQVRLFNVAGQTAAFSKEYSGTAANPRDLRAHHRRRDPQAAAQPDRRGADQAHVLVRSRRRADEGHGLRSPDQGDLHRRLRRRQPAPHHGEPLAQHQPGVVERRPGDRLHVVPPGQLPRHLRPADLRGHAAAVAGQRHRPHPQFPAGVVARRHQDRVHDQPRRQPGDLRDGRRRRQPAAHHPAPGRSTRRRRGRRPATRSPSPRIGRARRRSTSWTRTDSASRSASPPTRAGPTAPRGRRRRSTKSPTRPVRDRASTSRSTTCTSRASRLLTHGEGSNESPAFSPTGRHLAFASTRLGNQQIFVVGRDGNGLKQVTKEGNNFTPNWSR